MKPQLEAVKTIPGADPNFASLLTAKEVAVILNVPLKRVYELPLPRIQLSRRRIRYRREDLDQWLENRRTQ